MYLPVVADHDKRSNYFEPNKYRQVDGMIVKKRQCLSLLFHTYYRLKYFKEDLQEAIFF